MDHRGRVPIVTLAALLAVTPGPMAEAASVAANAAGESTGSVVVVTRDSATGRPLEGVMVMVSGTRECAITDLNGIGVIAGLKPGPARLRSVRYRHAPRTDSLVVRSGARDTVRIGLEPRTFPFLAEINADRSSSLEGRQIQDQAEGGEPAIGPIALISAQGHGVSLRVTDPLGRTWEWDGRDVVNRLPDCEYVAITPHPGLDGPGAGDDEQGSQNIEVTIRKLVPGEYIIRVTAREPIEPFVHVQMWEEGRKGGAACDIVALRRGAVATWAATWRCPPGVESCWAGLRRLGMR